MNYYSDDEFGYDDVEITNENKQLNYDINYIDVNILLDNLDDIVEDYSNAEPVLEYIRTSDYVFHRDIYICKKNDIVYEMSKILFEVIENNIHLLSEEDAKMFENITENTIYYGIMKSIDNYHINLKS